MTILGRSPELEVLAEDVSARRPALVTGEAGIGKTSLVRATAAASGLAVFEGLYLSTMWWVSYQAIRRALSLTDAEAAADPPAVAARVQDKMGEGLLVLDDLHWADPQTKTLLPMLAGKVRMLATMRSGYSGFEADVEALCAAGFERHHLGPLDTANTVQVVRNTRPNLAPERVGVVAAASGGNPLLAEELAKAESTSPRLDTLVESRVRDVPPGARRALAKLALLGRPAPVPLAEELGGAGALEALRGAELVTVVGGAVQIRHGLIGEWALADVTEADCRDLHRELAGALEDPGESARHHAAAGERQEAHRLALVASREAPTLGERIAHLRVAAECADEGAAELRLTALAELMRARECESALALAETIATDDDEIRAWVLYWQALGNAELLHVEEAAAAVEAGLRLAPEGSEVALRLREEDLRRLMYVDWNLPAVFAGAAALDESAAVAGYDLQRSRMYAGFARMLMDTDGWAENLEAVRKRARTGEDWNLAYEATQNTVLGLSLYGRMRESMELAAAAAGEAAAAGMARWATEFRSLEVTVALFLGDYDLVLEEAPVLLASHPTDRDRDMLCSAYAVALADRGHLDAAHEIVTTTLREPGSLTGQVMLPFILAEIALWADRPAETVSLYDSLPQSGASGTPVLFLRPTRAWACLQTGQEPGPPLPRFPFRFSHGPATETAALGRLANGSAEGAADAARLFTQAIEEYSGCLLRSELRCRWGRGKALLRAGDTENAIAELLAARSSAEAAGMAPLLRRIDATLREAGVPTQPGPTGPPGPPVLSERERQVLALVASGLTYAQIGRRLGISPRTVESHVTTARRKLGARTRAEAILLAGDLTPQG